MLGLQVLGDVLHLAVLLLLHLDEHVLPLLILGLLQGRLAALQGLDLGLEASDLGLLGLQILGGRGEVGADLGDLLVLVDDFLRKIRSIVKILEES